MNTILAATDFSTASRNAVNYAAELAKSYKAKLVLFHAYSLPVLTETPVPVATLDELEKEYSKKLKRLVAGLHKLFGSRLNIEPVQRCGFAVDEICDFVKSHNVSLVVAGMQGAGYISEKINGSISTALIAKVACPVLIIDRKIKYTRPRRIVLASDLREMQHREFSTMLKDLVTHYKAELQVLNVFKPNEVMPTVSEAIEGMRLDQVLKGIKHSFSYIESQDPVEGINRYVKENNTDMVVMIARKHNFFERLFKEPNTKKMAFHSTVPLLTLRD